MPQSAKRRLLDLLLDGQLDSLVADLRAQNLSWDRIARSIEERTGEYVTSATLQAWTREDVA